MTSTTYAHGQRLPIKSTCSVGVTLRYNTRQIIANLSHFYGVSKKRKEFGMKKQIVAVVVGVLLAAGAAQAQSEPQG